MFSLSNFKLKEMGNRNLLGILSSPVKRLCWQHKHTSSQIETALLCGGETGNVLKPIFEQNPSSVFSAALLRSHLLQHSANCLIQVFSVSEFQHFLYMSIDLSTESCLLSKIFPNSEDYCTSNTFTSCFYTWEKIFRKPEPKNNREQWQPSQQWLFFISSFIMTFLAIYYRPECVLVWWLIYLVSWWLIYLFSTDWIARDCLCRSCLENRSCLEV